MLSLSRKEGQMILIYPNEEAKKMTVEELFGENGICLEVARIKGSQVALRISANEDLVIVRNEILQN